MEYRYYGNINASNTMEYYGKIGIGFIIVIPQ